MVTLHPLKVEHYLSVILDKKVLYSRLHVVVSGKGAILKKKQIEVGHKFQSSIFSNNNLCFNKSLKFQFPHNKFC